MYTVFSLPLSPYLFYFKTMFSWCNLVLAVLFMQITSIKVFLVTVNAEFHYFRDVCY